MWAHHHLGEAVGVEGMLWVGLAGGMKEVLMVEVEGAALAGQMALEEGQQDGASSSSMQ
jgi:hypothetical protein